VRAVLRALGLPDDEAVRLATLPLPAFELPPTSILSCADMARR
jgi:hypothetical protein